MTKKRSQKRFQAPLVEFSGTYQAIPKGSAGGVRITSSTGEIFDVMAENPRTFSKLVGDLRKGGNIRAALEDDFTELVLRYYSMPQKDIDNDRSALIKGYYDGLWGKARPWMDHTPIKIRIPSRRSGNRKYHETILHVHLAGDLEPHLPDPGDVITAQGVIVQSGTRTQFIGTRSMQVKRYLIRIYTIQTNAGIFQTQLYPV